MCCCIMLVLCSVARSQTGASVPPIQALLHTPQSVSVNWRDKLVPITDTPFNTFPQQLLKTANGLYIFLDGSGRLYQLTDSSAGIQARRIDSTIFFGYNFGAFPFVYHDSLYSLGGYGMWRINGQLRVYVPQAHSWDIVPLNEEVPVLMQEGHHDMLWYNEQSSKLYIAYAMVRNQAVKHATLNEAAFDYTVRCLDLKTKDWHTAGTLNDYFKDKIALLRNIAFTPWGQLVSFGNKLLLVDYTHNRLLRMKEAAENAIRPVLFQHPTTNLYYCIDSILYFGNIAESRLHSLQLHSQNFIDAGIVVYKAPLSPAVFFTEWIVSTLVVLLLIFIVWKIIQQRTIINNTALNQAMDATLHTTEMQPEPKEALPAAGNTTAGTLAASSPIHFDEKELQVIQLILHNNRQSLPTTIDDVNAVLGLSRKSNDAQKATVVKCLNLLIQNIVFGKILLTN